MLALSASEMAFALVACLHAVLAGGWLLYALWVPEARKALRWWCACAGLNAVSLLFTVLALRFNDHLFVALSNLCLVGSLLTLQQGVWRFFDAAVRWGEHIVVILVALLVSWFGMSDAAVAVRLGLGSTLTAAVTLITAWDVLQGVRRQCDARRGALLAFPLLLGAGVFVARALEATLSSPPTLAERATSSTFEFGTAATMLYMLVALIFQLTLIALFISRLTTDLRRASSHDALTGLLNRRAIEEVLADEAQRARRLNAPFTVLMLDLDHFKSVNDQHGHPAGDRALQHLATILTANVRDIDRVGRYGGEEFLVLLPGTVLAQAYPLAERIREKVAELPATWQDAPVPLTVSVGVAEWLDDHDVTLLLSRADAALYRAKQDGRNRVSTSTARSAMA